MTGPGRVYRYDADAEIAIPSDFATDTCARCGEHYMTSSEYAELERQLGLFQEVPLKEPQTLAEDS